MKKTNTWNLKLLYDGPTDPRIEQDLASFERDVAQFVSAYNTPKADFLNDNTVLLKALKDQDKLSEHPAIKAILYFSYITCIDATNTHASAQLALIENRFNTVLNSTLFFSVALSKVDVKRQKEILSNKDFAHYHVFLSRLFSDAKYTLSVEEEKIMSLKDQPARSMWDSALERILNTKTVLWKKKNIPASLATQSIPNTKSVSERKKLHEAVMKTFGEVAPFAEAEINAIFTDKKINDSLRNYKTPYEATVVTYRNDPKVVETLRQVVSEHVGISHDFYAIKARLLKQKRLGYYDRAAKMGKIKATFTFEDTVHKLKDVFGKLNPKFNEYIDMYVKNGQMDVYPRAGKQSGAFCSHTYTTPTYLLLNHIDDLHSYTTVAHELGHAFHSEFSKIQGSLYCDYSFALAETASTLFEAIALEAVFDGLSDKEKITVLHDSINDDIATIFRQMACFNFELDLHTTIREKGYLSKEEICELHNKNMKSYLGPLFDMKMEDGYMFVQWEHIRRFFYVYSYAYGQLVSKALLRRYKQDPSFWKKIEQFLSAGGKDSPENILKEIGVDVYSPEFWKEGLMEIADNIALLKKLTSGKK